MTNTYRILFKMRYSARWLRWATRVTLQFNLMSGSKWRPMQQDWRSKPRIPKVIDEDADLGITHIGKGAELIVCFWRAHPDRSPQDSRLNQSVLSQEASSDQLIFVIHWGGMTTPRWQTNPKTWSRGGITLEEKKAGGNTTSLPKHNLNTKHNLQADSSRATAGSTFQIRHTKSSTGTQWRRTRRKLREGQTSSSW